MNVFPNTRLIDLNDSSFILDDLIQKDKLNLVLFYNTNCLGCTGRAIPFAYNLSKEYNFINLIVIHSNFRNQPFVKEEILSVFTDQKSPIVIYREEFNELYSYFDCDGTPHWFVIDAEKNITHSIFGSMDGSQMKLNYAILEFKENQLSKI
ncbi:MAG: thioredoxin family protein [Brumimicrobium sp.]